jgi:hypothetical protein
VHQPRGPDSRFGTVFAAFQLDGTERLGVGCQHPVRLKRICLVVFLRTTGDAAGRRCRVRTAVQTAWDGRDGAGEPPRPSAFGRGPARGYKYPPEELLAILCVSCIRRSLYLDNCCLLWLLPLSLLLLPLVRVVVCPYFRSFSDPILVKRRARRRRRIELIADECRSSRAYFLLRALDVVGLGCWCHLRRQ